VGNVIIAKAHANARSAYIITLELNKINHQVKVSTRLQMINDQIAADSITDAGVKKWMSIGEKNYAALGFDARKVVMANGEPLDGRESMIRTQTTNFTKLIVQAMKQASPESNLVLINSGSIRVDDILQMPVTQYDIIRSLPFGGSIMEVDMKGSLLLRIMAASLKNKGIGGFLQYSPELVNVSGTGNWSLNGNTIDPDKVYKIAITDFLMTGGEANMDFLKKDNPEVIKIYPAHTDVTDARSDIRLAIIKYMAGLKP
jgi:5'-nucleotidase